MFWEDFELYNAQGEIGPDILVPVVGENLGVTCGNILSRSYELLSELKPDGYLVLGDTNSCLSAISAKRLHIPLFHMEAGNRCKDECLPEETNRRIVDVISDVNCKRDFTYVDDIVEGVYRVMQGAPEKANGEDGLPLPPYAVYNIGGGTPENLLDYISTLQEELVRAKVLPEDYDFEAHRELVGMQPGDVPVTYADSAALERDYGFTPKIGIREGLRRFAEWYAEYNK